MIRHGTPALEGETRGVEVLDACMREGKADECTVALCSCLVNYVVVIIDDDG